MCANAANSMSFIYVFNKKTASMQDIFPLYNPN
jgi:hypothetical protein